MSRLSSSIWKSKKLTTSLTILLFFLVFGGTGLRYLLIRNAGKITVGRTTGISYGGQSSKYVNFTFEVKGEKYQGKRNVWGKKVKVPEGLYAIVYNKRWPSFNTILFDHPIDSLPYGSNLDSLIKIKEVSIGFWTL